MANNNEGNFLNIGGMTLERFLTLALVEHIENNVQKRELKKETPFEKQTATQE